MNTWNNTQKFCVLHSDDRISDMSTLQRCISRDGLTGAKGTPSPLHLATTGSNLDIIKFLITKNADINARDSQGLTPLHWAVSKGKKNTIQLLLNLGANIHMKDYNGWNILHYSAESGNIDLVTMIIEKYHFDINDNTHTGKSALSIACEEEEKNVIKYLCRKGANIKHSLHNHVRYNKPKIVYYLVKYGVISSSEYEDENNPLHLSVSLNFSNITNQLLKYAPWMMSCTNHQGKKPLDLITKSTSEKIKSLFEEYFHNNILSKE